MKPQAKPPEDMQFEDDGEFRTSQGESSKEIILRQFRRCLEEGSKEMWKGGTQRKIINGQAEEVFLPDQLQVFVNSCEMMRILITPLMKQHKSVIIEHLNDFDKEAKNIDDEFKSQQKKLYENARKIPEKNRQQQISQAMQMLIDQRRFRTAEIYKDNLLLAISMLLNEVNYLEEQGGYS